SCAVFPALVGGVEDRVVFLLQVRRAFDAPSAADVIVGRGDLRGGEAEMTERVEVRRAPGRLRDLHALVEILAEAPGGEGEADLENTGERLLDLFQLGFGEAFVQ